MFWTIFALWLTFQVGAIVGYLLHDYGPKPRRKLPTPPKLSGKSWITPRVEIIDEAA